MFANNDSNAMEYATLMERSRTIERTGTTTWAIATTAATCLLAWAVAADSPGRMLAAVFAAAAGFYPLVHMRQQVRLMAGYMKEFIEGRGSSPQWHTRLGHLEVLPTVNPSNDWVMTALSNAISIAAVCFSWVFAGSVEHGGVIAGFTTACGTVFTIHSISETSRVAQTDFAAVWRKVGTGPHETERTRAAS